MRNSPFISKSKYLSGLQCHKLLWHYYNAKDQIPQPVASTLAIFDQGHLVGEYAKKLFPHGIEVAKGEYDYEKVIKESQQLLSNRVPLFEAAFLYKNAYARADILNPVGNKAWEIIEVKSSTEVKDINLHDLSLQMYVYQGAGLKINRCSIMHINNEYVRDGEIEPKKLFKQEDVTDAVKALLPHVESNIQEMLQVVNAISYPPIKIGLQCNSPYDCPLQEKCFEFLPVHNPLTLYNFNKSKAFNLIHKGILDIRSIPKSVVLTNKQNIQIESLNSNQEYVNKKEIKSFLETLKYPLFYLDFETFGTALPLFDTVKPYQQIPFQFSLHIQDRIGAEVKHVSYLAEGKEDPRLELLRLLRDNLGTTGSIVTYNAPFEKDKLNKACEVYPEYRKWNSMIQKRIVDLLTPFRAFDYYHFNQEGSASIKSVLPVLIGKGYEGMEIADGGTASNEYLRVTFGDVTQEDRLLVRRNLEEYCKLDTMAMVLIVNKLKKLVE